MSKIFLLAGAVSGALSVAIGAFGAHGLKTFLEASNRMDTFETAVKYQFYHSLALILLGLLMERSENSFFNTSGWMYVAGIIVFSGSLYVLCLTGMRWLGAITPFGGLALIAGWLFLGWSVYKNF